MGWAGVVTSWTKRPQEEESIDVVKVDEHPILEHAIPDPFTLGNDNMKTSRIAAARFAALLLALLPSAAFAGEQWLQFKYDARHSGDAAERSS